MKLAVFFNLPAGGAKRTIYEQVKHLSNNHTVDVYTLTTANHDIFDLRTLTPHYYIYKAALAAHFPKSIIEVYTRLPGIHKEIAEDIHKRGYDAVVVHPDSFTQAPYLVRYLKIPSLYYCHEVRREFYENIPRVSKTWSYYATLPFRYPIKYIDKSNIKKATKILVNSYLTQINVRKNYHIESTVNYPGVDINVFKKDESIKKENMVLSVGGFNLLKGHDSIIRALGKIPKPIRPKLVIAGTGGEDKVSLTNLAKESGVMLEWKENISDRQLVTLYNKAKVLIFAPISEPYGLSPLEALSCGTFVIATKGNGVIEVLKKAPMVSIIEKNEQLMSTEITRLLKQEISPKNYSAVRDYLKDYLSWDKSVEELEKYLKKICTK